MDAYPNPTTSDKSAANTQNPSSLKLKITLKTPSAPSVSTNPPTPTQQPPRNPISVKRSREDEVSSPPVSSTASSQAKVKKSRTAPTKKQQVQDYESFSDEDAYEEVKVKRTNLPKAAKMVTKEIWSTGKILCWKFEKFFGSSIFLVNNQ